MTPQHAVGEILTMNRLTTARDAVTRNRGQLAPALLLTDNERATLRQALERSRHPLAGHACSQVQRVPQDASMLWASTLLLANKLLHDPDLNRYNTTPDQPAATSRCVACPTTEPLTPTGLCTLCFDDLRFVTRPPAHFDIMVATAASDDALRAHQWRTRGAVYIGTVDEDEQTWSCGYCWEPLPVDDPDTAIALIGTDGVCDDCVNRFPYWPGAWTRQGPRLCPCVVCQIPLPRRQLTTRIGLLTDPYRYSYHEIDRPYPEIGL